jgi:hypothetical protein
MGASVGAIAGAETDLSSPYRTFTRERADMPVLAQGTLAGMKRIAPEVLCLAASVSIMDDPPTDADLERVLLTS